MQIFKKLLFAPLFLIFLTTYLYHSLGQFSLENALSFNFLPLIYLCIYLILTSFFYVLFISLAQDIKFAAPFIILGSIIPVFLFDLNLALVLGFGILIVLFSGFYQLVYKLKTYLTFSPTALLIPSVKLITTLLILVLSFGYYLSINKTIKEEGFSVPDSLIDATYKFTMPSANLDVVKGNKYLSQITQEQIDFLRQNPELLKQQGLDPSVLDNLSVSTSKSNAIQQGKNQAFQVPTISSDLTKKLVKNQFNKMLDPYINFIAPFLAILFFITLQSLLSVLSLALYPLISLLFYILERSGFIKFISEMREVKKMVV